MIRKIEVDRMDKERSYQISAICMTISAFCMFGIAILAVTNQRMWLAAITLFGFAINLLGAFLTWREYYKCRF